jgi:hypothetical protein
MMSRRLHLLPLLATQATGLLCGLLGLSLASTLIAPEVLGTYGLLISAHTLAAFVTHQGLIRHVQRTWTASSSIGRYSRQLFPALSRSTAWLAIGTGIVIIYLRHGAGVDVGWSWWAWLLAVNIMAFAAHVGHALLQAEQRYWADFAVSSVGSLTRTFLPLSFAWLAGAELGSLAVGFIAHNALWLGAAAVALLPILRRGISGSASEEVEPADAMKAFLGVGITGWIAQNAPRWLAANVLDAENTGYFILASNLTIVVPAAISAIGNAYTFPSLFADHRTGSDADALRHRTQRDAAMAVLAGQVALVAIAGLWPWLVGPLVSIRYDSAVNWLLAAGGGTLATVSASFYCNLLLALGRERDCLRLMVFSTAARLLILGTCSLGTDLGLFSFASATLALPTYLLESWLVRRWLSARKQNGRGKD